MNKNAVIVICVVAIIAVVVILLSNKPKPLVQQNKLDASKLLKFFI
jgi:hypothetical protein